jgi:hypothetical protein
MANEEILDIMYTLQLEKPKLQASVPQDEWISSIRSLSHILNDKAKTYIVGFFNGDLKVFNKHDHQEMFSIKQLHEDSSITDSLFVKNDSLNSKVVITCSQMPNP